MIGFQTHTSRDLTLEIADVDGGIKIKWLGKSTAREPSLFLAPILTDVLRKSVEENKPIILDFTALEYMNSSTITPIIRLLDNARRGSTVVKVFYNKKLKWQELNFSALEIFQTNDKRIQIIGGDGG